MLTLRHLSIFRAVAETGSFTKAAQKLYITQSAVSHTVRELEEYTGSVLFDRLSKRARLTSGGRLLLEEIAPILASCEALEKRIGKLEQQAPVRIVSSITIAAFRLPGILRRFGGLLEEVPVYVNVVTAAEALRVLRSGDADIAFVEGAAAPGPFICSHFDSYRLKAVCAPSYPAAGTRLNVKRFCSERLLLREPGSAIRDTLDSQLFLLGRSVHPLWTSVNSTALLEAAKAGLGVAVLPEALVLEELSAGRLVSLETDGLSMQNDLFYIYHKDKHLTHTLKTLLSCIPAR